MNTHESFESLFDEFRDDAAILRNEAYARWSLASIFPDVDLVRNGKQQPVQRDYQSIGAVLASQLATKIAGALFPSTQSFFRLDSSVDTDRMAAALATTSDVLATGLSNLENDAYRRLFLNDSYNQVVQTIKLLICTGNALLYRNSPDKTMHAYSMRQYVVRRDGTGKVWEMLLKERISVEGVPDSMKHMFKDRKASDDLRLWTRIKREPREHTDVFVVTQQIECEDVPQKEPEVYPAAICPYIPIAWNLVTGEHMGRGLVEDFAGDFAKLSELSESLALYEIEACRVLHMAKQGSGTDVDSLGDAESGEWISGDPTTVAAYEAGDYNKIQAILADIQQIFQRLAPAFMYGNNTRDAERVTAEEIQMNAQQAEQALGGVYSSLSASMHIPLAHILCSEVNPQFVLEVLRGGLTLNVLTGTAALGRSADVTKLAQAAQILAVVLPALTNIKSIDPQRVTAKVFEGFGLDLSEYSYTEDELKQLQSQAATPVDPTVAQSAQAINPQGVL